MATSKPKKSRNRIDPEQLKSEVASFASSLGFSSAAPSSSGFNDIDFRNPSRPKTPKTPKTQNPNHTKDRNADKNNKNNNNKRNNNSNNIKEERPKPGIQPQPQSHAQSPLAPIDNSKLYEKFRNLPKLPLMKATSLAGWYEDAAKLEEKVLGSEVKRKKVEFKDVEEWKTLVAQKKELAERLLAQYVQDYEASRGQSGDIKMVIATQRSGTATDKVSALSVLIGDNPIANIKSIDALIGMVTSKVGKRYAFTGFETLKEMFIESLLPDRKLKTLFQQHLNHLPETKDGYSLLLFWHWEECLKQRYERYIFALEEASKDVLATLKDRASKIIYALLRSKSEQERRLLSGLVNKLGDPENKAASNADFLLTKLLSEHPNMKAVVIDEVDNFLFRPHLGLRAKYHAVNFLSQIRLHHRGDGPKVAKRLVDLYFALFKLLISEARGLGKQKDGEENKKTSHTSKDKDVKSVAESHVEMDSRLLSALLTGVNRAFPFVSSNEADDVIEVQTPMLFQLVHSKNFNVGIQSLMLLDKISSKNQIVSDRFYRALYSKLLTPSAMNSSKEEMLIGLLLRAMKNDINLKRVAAFAKRLLQVALQQPPQHACGILFLLSEILKARPPLWNLVLQNESADDELEHFEDVVEEAATEAGNIADKPDIAAEASPDSGNLDADDDDDSPLNEGASPSAVSEDESDDDFLANGRLGNLQETELISTHSNDQPGAVTLKPSLPGGYNPRHREPSFCNADRVSWWELTVLASHVHPSVATMAKTLLSGANIVYNGNPLTDLSLTAFLDKLMEKKPKQSAWHGGSEIEPANKLDMSDQKIGAAILELDETDVAPEDLVFHKFYMNKLNSSKRSKKKKKKGAEEDGAEDLIGEDGSESDGDSDIDEEEIDKMLDSTDGALDADGEYDYDDLDQIVNEDDDDLVGDDSDGEEFPMDEMGGDDEEAGMDEFDEDTINTGDEQDESDREDIFDDEKKKKKRKRKEKTKAGASPFASAEAYKHLLEEENPVEAKQKKGKKEPKSRKKRKPSK